MKYVVIFFAVLLAFTIVSAKKHKHNDEEKGKSLKKVFKECQKKEETRIDGSILKKLKKHKQVDLPANFGDHKLCVLKGVGYINEDNTVNEENLKKRVTKKAQDQDVDAIVSECKVPKATPQDTAINIETCLNGHSIEI
nr:odorant binding protein 23 [Pagiophloeus tsushimanus]